MRLASIRMAACVTAALGFAALLAPQSTVAEAPKPAPGNQAAKGVKRDLTPESWLNLHTLIRPGEQEWRHLKVEWLTDVVAARKKAAKEDKPIVICYTGGAGYNEPLGTC